MPLPREEPKESIEILEARPVYENRYCVLFDDRVLFPNGAEGTYVRLEWKAPASVAVLPLLHDGRIALIRCFRHAARRWVYEVPKGFGKAGQTSGETAADELAEELGLRAEEIRPLGSFLTDPGMIANPLDAFLASGCQRVGPTRHETFELIREVEPLSLEEALREIAEGGIVDVVTILLIQAQALKR